VSAAKKKVKRIRITLENSTIHRQGKQKRIVAALGLRKLHQSVVHDDSPTIRGMVNKIPHLVKVESVEA